MYRIKDLRDDEFLGDLPDGCWKVAGSGEMLENTTRIPPLRAVVLERVS